MKSSQDLNKQAEELRKKLDKIRKEVRKAEKLEQAEAARLEREARIDFAFRFVEAAKQASMQNGETFFDFICRTAGIREPGDEQDHSKAQDNPELQNDFGAKINYDEGGRENDA